MPTLFQKLNLGDHKEIAVLNAPESFEPALAELDDVTVRRDAKSIGKIHFAIAFVQTLAEVEKASKWIAKMPAGDVIVWLAYPKGTSKRFKCEFNRDNGWAAIRAVGFDTVRQVAIDEDWSALRFRRKEFIGK
jgi:hypothetical protein